MSLAKPVWIFGALVYFIIVVSDAEIAVDKCPSPDNKTDVAEAKGRSNIQRPPAGISQFNVTGIGPYAVNVSWSSPTFNFNGTTTCHFYLNISHTPSQKGSHQRTTHINYDHTRRSASLQDLTPDTNVTIQLRTCLLMPSEKDFICTQSVDVTAQTAPNPDRCPSGFYNGTDDECVPCQCHNKTKLCEFKTGKCIDCLEGSDGENCESCLGSYVRTDDNRCEYKGSGVFPFEVKTLSPTLPLSGSVRTDKTAPSGSTAAPDPKKIKPAVSTSTASISTASPGQNSTTHIISSPVTIKTPVSIIVTSVLIGAAIISCVAFFIYRKCGGCRKKPMQFWTIQLQADNQPAVAYSDILEPQMSTREDNRLIDNDFTARFSEHQFVSDENPYRPITA